MLNEAVTRTAPTANTVQNVTGSSTSAIQITTTSGWYRFANRSTSEIIHILFGTSAVSAATTSNAMPIFPGTAEEFWINGSSVTHYRAIATSSADLVVSKTSA